jgi:exopolyphosphatase/guanosine-5'-triphosphate,3'-diphosphate pyrophosphatase
LKLAAIDIGSNAIRLQITKVLLQDGSQPIFKKMEYVRFPLRLGKDVFAKGEIGEEKKEKFIKLMRAFKLLMDLYEIDHYMACATSAMRESVNGKEVVGIVKGNVGIEINIIDGDREASMINKAISSSLTDDTYLHIDVGGGSTELNLYAGGDKIHSISFKMGSVRRLQHHDSPEVWTKMEDWVKEHVKSRYGAVTAIGTGGNINKIYDLAVDKGEKIVSLTSVKTTINKVKAYSYDDRVNVLRLNPDRADVIVPASEIYISVMEWANSDKIIVPDVGLKDGILLELYQKHSTS